MATFYYNRYSNENIQSQWVRHLQTNAYINDIDNIVSQNKKDLENTIQNASDEQKEAIKRVCGTLEAGFNEMNEHLKDINFNITELRGEISEMAAMLDWKLSLMIEEQRLTNHFLGHIAQLLKIPESQKQRTYHIEQGLKYLKNAILEGDNSSFFADALECLKDAEKIEKRDHITLSKIGFIHLYSNSPGHLNFALAEEYFLKSAREAFAEANAAVHKLPEINEKKIDEEKYKEEIDKNILKLCDEGSKMEAVKFCVSKLHVALAVANDYVNRLLQLRDSGKMNNLNSSDISLRPKKTNSDHNNYIQATAEAYLYGGRACYLQDKLEQACALACKAYTLVPEFLEAGFEYAKYLSANNQEAEAVSILKTVIDNDRFFTLKIHQDGDLRNRPLILGLLHRLQLIATKRASEKLAECKVIVNPKSEATEIIAKIEEGVTKMNFLSSMKALDLLTKEYQLPYIQYSRDGERIRYTILTTPQNLLALIKAENLANRHFLEIREEAKKEIMNNRVLSGGCGGAGIGFFIGFFKGCTIQTFSMDGGILFGMILAFAVVGAGFGALTAASADPEIYKT